jgi:hypothetical protein
MAARSNSILTSVGCLRRVQLASVDIIPFALGKAEQKHGKVFPSDTRSGIGTRRDAPALAAPPLFNHAAAKIGVEKATQLSELALPEMRRRGH